MPTAARWPVASACTTAGRLGDEPVCERLRARRVSV